jgi:hypothetical protein
VGDQRRSPQTKLAPDGIEIEQVKLRSFQSDYIPSRSKLRGGLDEVIADESTCASDPGKWLE